MNLCSPTLIKFYWKILSRKWFFKFWSRDEVETKIVFLVAILKRYFFGNFFLLIYGCIRCLQVRYKFRTKFLREST